MPEHNFCLRLLTPAILTKGEACSLLPIFQPHGTSSLACFSPSFPHQGVGVGIRQHFLEEVGLIPDALGRVMELSKLEGATKDITAKEGTCEQTQRKKQLGHLG